MSCHIGGRGLAVGFSTRPKLQDALAGAIKELCQSELAMAVIAVKLSEGGPAQLSAQDRNHLARATVIDAEGTCMLWPWGAANLHEGALPNTPETSLNWITSRLHAVGMSAYVIDLSRNQFSMPVVRVFAPGLQIAPSGLISPRLAAVRLSNSFHISDEPPVELF